MKPVWGPSSHSEFVAFRCPPLDLPSGIFSSTRKPRPADRSTTSITMCFARGPPQAIQRRVWLVKLRAVCFAATAPDANEIGKTKRHAGRTTDAGRRQIHVPCPSAGNANRGYVIAKRGRPKAPRRVTGRTPFSGRACRGVVAAGALPLRGALLMDGRPWTSGALKACRNFAFDDNLYPNLRAQLDQGGPAGRRPPAQGPFDPGKVVGQSRKARLNASEVPEDFPGRRASPIRPEAVPACWWRGRWRPSGRQLPAMMTLFSAVWRAFILPRRPNTRHPTMCAYSKRPSSSPTAADLAEESVSWASTLFSPASGSTPTADGPLRHARCREPPTSGGPRTFGA